MSYPIFLRKVRTNAYYAVQKPNNTNISIKMDITKEAVRVMTVFIWIVIRISVRLSRT
jgi:hypothetical protein